LNRTLNLPRFTSLDALLLLMTIIWGTNFSVIKSAVRELDPQAFNAVRMVVASLAFLAVMAVARRRFSTAPNPAYYSPARVTARDWGQLALLGLVGHVVYQFCFIGGLARTSVANSSLMLAMTPVLIAVISAALGHERIARAHWIGAGISTAGIYLVVGKGFALGGPGLAGDLLMFGAVVCWAIYTLGARPLMERHSPLAVTGLSMALGTLVYLPLVWPRVRAVQWTQVSAWSLGLSIYSALFALCVAYTIWYVAVREIGSARTSAYSNLIPVVAMGSAVLVLGEPLDWRKAIGAVAVLAGVALTRAGSQPTIPAEE
jgi:drug/metabolite transporter (DMT)-like permease